MQIPENAIDVTVIGGGLAGMAASIHLSRAGLRVLCIEPDVTDTDSVGELLDWSAPGLLDGLGLTMDQLIAEKIATYKRHVTLKLGDGIDRSYVPGEWLGRPPFNVELRTLHVDRGQLNQLLRGMVLSEGVTFLQDKVVSVETSGRRVTAVSTQLGNKISSPWFIDASGARQACLRGSSTCQCMSLVRGKWPSGATSLSPRRARERLCTLTE
jgi:menaquinone-9 beta-reductase